MFLRFGLGVQVTSACGDYESGVRLIAVLRWYESAFAVFVLDLGLLER